MNATITLIVIDILLPGLITWVLYRFKPKFLWCAPAFVLLVLAFLFIRDINVITTEPTFAEKWELYFHNDWSMGLYLVYLPIVAASSIFTLVAYLIKHFKGRPS